MRILPYSVNPAPWLEVMCFGVDVAEKALLTPLRVCRNASRCGSFLTVPCAVRAWAFSHSRSVCLLLAGSCLRGFASPWLLNLNPVLPSVSAPRFSGVSAWPALYCSRSGGVMPRYAKRRTALPPSMT
ncbi:hypothetical protein D3C85_1375820 [compost metagenome]